MCIRDRPSGDTPAAMPTPAADAAATLSPSATPDVYPPLPTPTHTLPPYPWPTVTPGPTDPPEPTEVPTETIPPVPTMPPTPVVTRIPPAAPPFVAFPEGTTAQPFTLYYRDGEVILSLSSAPGATPQPFLDPWAEFGHYLPPRPEVVSYWGALSPDGRTMALNLTDDPVSKAPGGATDWFSPAPHPVTIYLMDMTTRELRHLVADGFIPVWSPDSRRLAYRSTQTFGLWIVDVTTGEAREVYPVSDGHFVNEYAWAFDNRHMSLTDELLFESRELIVIDTDGVTAPQSIVPEKSYGTSLAQWSPISNQITLALIGEGRDPLSDLWIMNPDGTDRRQLTRDLHVLGGLPQWSPDSRWIVISALAAYEAEPSWYDLWLVDPANAELRRLTYDEDTGQDDDLGNDIQPMWSPDGTQLIYFKSSAQLWVMSLIDGSSRQLLQSENDLYDSGLVIGR